MTESSWCARCQVPRNRDGKCLNCGGNAHTDAMDDAMRRVAFGAIVSDFDHDRDGPKIADALRAQPEVAAAEYDPASRSVNVTLTGEALGLMPIMVEAIGAPLEVVGVRAEYEGDAKVETFPVTVRQVLRRG